MTKMVFIGVPFWLGRKDEYTGAVEVICDSGIAEAFGAAWVDITPDFSDDIHPVTAVNRALAAAIQAHSDALPLIVAGDCTACVGAMKGLEAHAPRVLWYDAHGDFNTPETSPSGFLGGMPLAAMVGRGSQWLLEGVGMSPIAEERVVLVDARDLDPQEGEMVRSSRLTHLHDVAEVTRFAWGDEAVYLHFDGDVIRLEDNPAVSYPAAGGPTLAACVESARAVLKRARVVGVFFTMWNHHHPETATSQAALLHVIRAVAETVREL